jgi:hypothetical protein
MKFGFLLYVLYIKLFMAAKHNKRFQDFIKNKELKVTVKTSDDYRGRQYVFNKGRISMTSATGVAYDTAMVWCDADTAFKVMSSSDEEVSLAALTERKLVVDGNFKDFAWFSRALAIMMGKP